MTFAPEKIIDLIQTVIGSETAILHEPCFEGNEEKYVADCVKTGWVSSVGSYVDQFERMLEEITGATKAIAVSSGTSGLLIALKLAGVEADEEVIVPAFTFVATANAVAHCNAIPHFVDIEPDTLGIDPTILRHYLAEITESKNGRTVNKKTGRIVSAVIPMHAFGHPMRVDELMDVASEYNLNVVEDAAESLGSFFQNQHTGTFGKLGVISFNGNKICSTGGGGAILTNDLQLGEKAKHLTTTAKVSHAWEYYHDQVGFNFRMPNLNAALGCAQLEQLENFVQAKRELAQTYQKTFASSDVATILHEPAHCRSNYWLNTMILEPEYASRRDTILREFHQHRIMARPAWELMTNLPMYSECPASDLTHSRDLHARVINLPSGLAVAARASNRNPLPC